MGGSGAGCELGKCGIAVVKNICFKAACAAALAALIAQSPALAAGYDGARASALGKSLPVDAAQRKTWVRVAESVSGDDPALTWKTPYDPAPSASFITKDRSIKPMLGPESVRAMQQAIAQYQYIERRGGWRPIPGGPSLGMGSGGHRVVTLRERLEITGDLTRVAKNRNRFDLGLEAAIRKFQLRHGLRANGVVDQRTRRELNVPTSVRLKSLIVNLPRVMRLSKGLGLRYVVVNIPAAEIETVQDGYVYSRHVAVVGKADRATPDVASRITQLNFNPFWHVPVSIVRKDLLPMIRKNRNYLKDQNIRVYKRYNGPEIDASEIDWETVNEKTYLFRQDPGRGNSMGSVRINFPNKHQVYLHDTPTKSLFGQNLRFHSSGCVRVDKVHVLTEWLLRGNEDWNREKIDHVAVTGDRMDVNLKRAVPLRMIYMTAWAKPNGEVHFRPDIYNRDGETVAAVDKK
jgi:murein L,D-transpeptidase YcbB/YkuD